MNITYDVLAAHHNTERGYVVLFSTDKEMQAIDRAIARSLGLNG